MGTALGTALAGGSRIVVDIQNKKTDSAKLADTLDNLNINTGINWSFGTGENQANLLFHDSDSTDDTGKTINVTDGSVKTPFDPVTGLTMEALKLLYVKNTHATLYLEVLGGATPLAICEDASDIIVVPPGGWILWVDPSAAGIVTTANKNLKFASVLAGTITFDYVIMGLD